MIFYSIYRNASNLYHRTSTMDLYIEYNSFSTILIGWFLSLSGFTLLTNLSSSHLSLHL